MKKLEKQLNNMLRFAQKQKLNDDEMQEISKIGFLYSVGRMSPLEVALRLWYLCNHNLDSIYGTSFQNFIDQTCRQ